MLYQVRFRGELYFLSENRNANTPQVEKRSQFLQLLEEVMDAAQQATSIEH